MRRLIFTLLLTTIISLGAKAEIQFQHGPWQEILAKAAKENKLVFVDAYTTWCGPCKWMAANTFTDEAVAKFFNEHFINAKIDMEKGEGPEIAEKYQVRAYPTLLFISGTGELIHTAIGALDPAQFLELGNNVIDPNFASLHNMRAKFAAGETDRAFLAKYILALKEINEQFDAPLAIFRPGMAGAALLEDDNWAVFDAAFTKMDSDEAKYFLSHLKEFGARHGEEAVNYKALMMYSAPMFEALYNAGTPAQYEAARKVVINSGVDGAEVHALSIDTEWYRSQSDWAKYAQAVTDYVAKSPDIYPNVLNNLAWSFYENVDDPKMLKNALKWATKAVEAEPGYANLDTKAMLQMKLGDTKEAIKTAKEAIKIAKSTGEDYSSTQEALDQMQGGN